MPSPPRTSPLLLLTAALAIIAATTPPAAAIQPARWTHSTEADFAAGEFDGVVVTNLGDLKLAAAVETLGELPEDVTVIYDIQVLGDTTYIAAGPEGKLLALNAGEITEVAVLEAEQVFTLSSGGGGLLVGISGESARVARLVDGQLETLCTFPETRYIWDMLRADRSTKSSDDDVYVVATGPEGKVFSFPVGGGDPEVLLDTAQTNVLCLAAWADRAPIYAGTDTDGLIYRIDADGSAFVVYDADEPEIGTLLVTDDGTVYAGTADAEQAKPGRIEEPASQETGRPPGARARPGAAGGRGGARK